jgi:polyisoprenoid-binding protein YceI
MPQRHPELASNQRFTRLLSRHTQHEEGHMSKEHAGLIQVLAEQPSNPSCPPLAGTWTIDPAQSGVSLAWRKHQFGYITARRHCLGVIHLDALPSVGVVRFEQPSGLPVLTMALDAASVEPHNVDLDATLGGPGVGDVLRHRWWVLRSESLEILPTGGWRVMAILTANSTSGLVELHFDVDCGPSDPDWLVLRGHGVLDRHALGIGRPASTRTPPIRLDLSVRARRVESSDPHREER